MYLSDRNTTIASLIFNIFCVKFSLKKVVDRRVWSLYFSRLLLFSGFKNDK